MKKNIGTIDKAFRIVVGIIILIVGIVYSSWLGLIGLLPLVTALTGNCPAYLPCGISTCKTKATKQE
jgi:hypothetical protein